MLLSTFTTLFLAVSSVSANPNRLSGPHSRHVNPHHRSVAKMVRSIASTITSPVLEKRGATSKKCTASSSSSSSNSTSSTSTSDGSGDDDGDDGDDDGDDGGDDGTTTTTTATTSTHTGRGGQHTSTVTSADTATATGDASSQGSTGTKTSADATGTGTASSSGSTGVAVINDPTCGPNNPSATTTKSSGPNGEESWFNCGLTGGGWTPPVMKLEQMVYVSAEDALAMDNTPYGPCKSNLDKFNSYASKYNLPAIMLMSFAMQESTCNNNIQDPAGTIGMFQLAPENCPSGVDCTDIDNNFEYACKLIIQYLSDANGNVVKMVGAYNGWYDNMTESEAKKAPCDQQQNLDYLQQWANAWMQGTDGYSVGSIQNCNSNFGKRKRSLFVPRFARDTSAPKEIGWHF
ncbi:hypothetical protein FRB97_006223 [Tulasnella sp. 331]|nr:hypothetical protein FRB97_006223 [Tulasnella sp. 331]KAG8887275.1 hypothetical protein FRB98_000261 [Tulasnella sp. 332]